MNTPRRGVDTSAPAPAAQRFAQEEPAVAKDEVVELDDDTMAYAAETTGTAYADSRAPRTKHFDRLHQLMIEALDEGDDFSRAQAQAVLERMMNMLGPDYSL